jgi:hypothetical protein
MADVHAEDVLEGPAADDRETVEALAANASDPALDVRVRSWRRRRRSNDPAAFGGEDGIERRAELAVPVWTRERTMVQRSGIDSPHGSYSRLA